MASTRLLSPSGFSAWTFTWRNHKVKAEKRSRDDLHRDDYETWGLDKRTTMNDSEAEAKMAQLYADGWRRG